METRAIGAAQTVPKRGDVDANVAQHLELVREAALQRAALLVFPELSLTGYELELASELSFRENDERLAPLATAAAQHDMTLVVGAPVRLGTALHIGAFILTPEASLLYTKQHLGTFSSDANPGGPVPPPEPSIFQPGTQDPLVRVQGRVAAVAICADTGRAAHAQAAATRGADLYLASMFFTPAEVDAESARFAGYAAKHGMIVAAANYGGPTGSLPAGGHSAVWSPAGEVIAQLNRSGAGLALAFESSAGWHGKTR